MSECGIKKYDELPARVGFLDVDSLRYRYANVLDEKITLEILLEEAIKRNKEAKQ